MGYTEPVNKPLLDRIGERPTLAIRFAYWWAQVLIGTIILLPTYEPENATPALAAGLVSLTAIKIYGGMMLFPGLIGLFYMWRPHRREAVRAQKILTFWSFLIFTFFALIRMLTFGIGNLVWVAYALCALTMGIVHLRLNWEGKR